MLLVDEVDRVELETEALLLEILSEYQVSIPELGTVRATQIPLVFLTSNNTRELSEALKRRCLYLHIDYPQLDRERAIIETRVPGISEALADQVARIVRSIRTLDLKKDPVGVRDPGLGPHPGACSGSSRSTPSRPGTPSTSCSSTRPTSSGRPRSWPGSEPAGLRPGDRAVLDLLTGFVAELRAAGIPVSLTEHLDAAEALRHVPMEDREAIKYTLGASLVKSSSHWRAYETAFEIYFSLRGPEYRIDGRPGRPGSSTPTTTTGAARPGRPAGPGRGGGAAAARG